MFIARASMIALALISIPLILIGPVWGQPNDDEDTGIGEDLSSSDTPQHIINILRDVESGNVPSWEFGHWVAACRMDAVPERVMTCRVRLNDSVVEIESSTRKTAMEAPRFGLRSYGNHRGLIAAIFTIDDNDSIEFSGTYGMPDQVAELEKQIEEGRQIEVRFVDRYGAENLHTASLEDFRKGREFISAIIEAYVPEADDLKIISVTAVDAVGEWRGFCRKNFINGITLCDILSNESFQISVYKQSAAGEVAELYILPKMEANGIRNFVLRVGDYSPFHAASFAVGDYVQGRDAEIAILQMLGSDIIRYSYRDSDNNFHSGADYLLGFREVHAAVLKLSIEFGNTNVEP